MLPAFIPGAQGAVLLEGESVEREAVGRAFSIPGGVWKHGTREEDSPVTWEALITSMEEPVMRSAGNKSPRAARPRMHALLAHNSIRPEVDRQRGTTAAAVEGDEGVGWPRKS